MEIKKLRVAEGRLYSLVLLICYNMNRISSDGIFPPYRGNTVVQGGDTTERKEGKANGFK